MLNIINSDKVDEYIKDKKNVSVKMICKEFGVKPKIAHRILKYNQHTILDSPHNYGSNKFKNYNLYRVLEDGESDTILSKEMEGLKKRYNDKRALENFMAAGLSNYMMSRYRMVM